MSESQDSDEFETMVGHTKADSTDVYAGRGPGGDHMMKAGVEIGDRGWLGNPYTTDDYHRAESIERFRGDFERRLAHDPDFRKAVHDLAGKTLGCWCQQADADEPPCHAEVIADHADRLARTEVTQ